MEKILRNRRSMSLLFYVTFAAWVAVYAIYDVQRYRQAMETALAVQEQFRQDFIDAAQVYLDHAQMLGIAIMVATALVVLYLWVITTRLKQLKQLRSRGVNLQQPQNYEVLGWQNWIPLCALFIASHIGIVTFGDDTTKWLVRCVLPVVVIVALFWLIEPKLLGIKKEPKLRLTREEAARQKQARAKHRKAVFVKLILPLVCLIALIVLMLLGKWKAVGITFVVIFVVIFLIALFKYIKNVLTKSGFNNDDTVSVDPEDTPELHGHRDEHEEDSEEPEEEAEELEEETNDDEEEE